MFHNWLASFAPIFPYIEYMCRPLRADARQDYVIGGLADGVSAEQLEQHLVSQGFETMIFAWVDDGQTHSLRKKDGQFQYHLRIFNDGEVRGHYEYAPESAPLKHLRRVKREARSAEFRQFVRGLVLENIRLYQDTISSVRQAGRAPSYQA